MKYFPARNRNQQDDKLKSQLKILYTTLVEKPSSKLLNYLSHPVTNEPPDANSRQKKLLELLTESLERKKIMTAGEIRSLVKQKSPEMYDWSSEVLSADGRLGLQRLISYYPPELEDDLDKLINFGYLKKTAMQHGDLNIFLNAYKLGWRLPKNV